jgi:hypothetical protein
VIGSIGQSAIAAAPHGQYSDDRYGGEEGVMRRVTAASVLTNVVLTGAAVISMPVLTEPAVAAAEGGATVPFSAALRRCDFSNVDATAPTGEGTGTAVVSRSGDTITAVVDFVTPRPGGAYTVRLIQAPRPSSARCAAADPGVVSQPLFLAPNQLARVTLTDQVEPGATGAWLAVERGAPFSSQPAEFYTSDYIAGI